MTRYYRYYTDIVQGHLRREVYEAALESINAYNGPTSPENNYGDVGIPYPLRSRLQHPARVIRFRNMGRGAASLAEVVGLYADHSASVTLLVRASIHWRNFASQRADFLASVRQSIPVLDRDRLPDLSLARDWQGMKWNLGGHPNPVVGVTGIYTEYSGQIDDRHPRAIYRLEV